jgi:CubicO group peptidase (beta-lactamase class C family)
MTGAIADGVFPGGVILVDVAGEIRWFEAYGSATTVPTPEPLRVDAVFDLASLTKPLVTAALTLSLAAEKRVSLDDPVSVYVPAWRDGTKAHATLRHLLSHTAGLPAWRAFYQSLDASLIATPEGKRRIVEHVEREPLESEPGADNRYSDLGFILLGAILEIVARRPLDALARDRVMGPLNVSSVAYLPAAGSREWLKDRQVAATEQCAWRGRVLRGEVHDENAYAMGGVSGHAGLFGDATGVRSLVRAWREAVLGRSALWPVDLAATFVTPQSDLGQGHWALGWTVPTPPSTSGRFFSQRAYGHLGFTGTSVWVDPDRELTVILLTNRVHPTRGNQGITAFRPLVHDAVYRWLFDGSSR